VKILFTNFEITRLHKAPGASSKSSLSAAERELGHDLAVTRVIVIVGFVLGLVVLGCLWGFNTVEKGFTVFFWALACYAMGSLMGFLFGIPRVLQGHSLERRQQSGTDGKVNESPAAYRLLVNTNLDDISDWLTKIVVGVGLVELEKFPSLIHRLASMIGGGGRNDNVAFVIAVILYFSVLGFMSGYLTTRMFLQRAFRVADLAAGGNGDAEPLSRGDTLSEKS
jgi:hypothetical protein